MSKGSRIINYLSIAFLIIMLTACVPSKKSQYHTKKGRNSRVETTQLGRNKYYFSSGYQKKLNKTFKKKRY
jgi:hypothetical protein